MTERHLVAYINGTAIGTLREVNGIWELGYSAEWLNNSRRYPLSPALPLNARPLLDQSTVRPVQWYFDNLLPEEGQRMLLAKDAQIDAADAFALLEYYGAESAGSVTLLPPTAPPPDTASLRPLSDAELDQRIRHLPRVPLTHGAVKRMSLAGAQHKLAMVLQGGELFEPAGQTPSTHILKPDHPDDDYPHSAVNEWFVMRLARKVGLQVPDVHRRYVPSPVYIIDRFDRTRSENRWLRRHTLDACQLLGLARSFKYSQGSVETLAKLASACRSPAVARTRLFGWLVFNALVGNSDAHLKNLSFLVSHEGIQLAPFYDLLSIAAYDTRAFDKTGWPETTQLAWPILGVSRFSELSRELLLDAGQQLKLARGTAARILDSLRGGILKEAQALYEAVELENQELTQTAGSGLAAVLSGELRCLRTIQAVVIRDMVARLG